MFKFLKNIIGHSSHRYVQDCCTVYMPELLDLMLGREAEDDLRLELISLLSYIKIGDEWLEFLERKDFVEFLNGNLVNTEDDLVLENLTLLANLVEDAKCAQYLETSFAENFIIENRMVRRTCALFIEKSDDEEFIVQTSYVLYQFLYNRVGIEFVMGQEDVLILILNLIQHPNEKVKSMNDELIDIIGVLSLSLIIQRKTIQNSWRNPAS